jgi:hypothetical protein
VPKTAAPMKMRELHLDDEDTNTDVMMVSELGFLQRGILGTCAYYLRGIPDDVEASLVEDVLRGCTRMRFFVVVRPSAKVKPELTEDGDHYRGGDLVGDAVVFDLQGQGPPKALGAFPLEVQLSKPVEVRIDATKNDVQYSLDEALRREVLVVVEKKIGG